VDTLHTLASGLDLSYDIGIGIGIDGHDQLFGLSLTRPLTLVIGECVVLKVVTI
jgi:hypothetical protein